MITVNKRIGFVVDEKFEKLLDTVCLETKVDRSLMIRTMIVDYVYKNHRNLYKEIQLWKKRQPRKEVKSQQFMT
mgnify:FL=1